MTLKGEAQAREILEDFAIVYYCKWIPYEYIETGGGGFYTRKMRDYDQVLKCRIKAKEEFVEWNLKMMRDGIQPEGSRKPMPSHIRYITSYWAVIRRATLAFYDYRCFTCGGPAEEVHHVRPREYGGTDHPSNLIPLCTKCHKEVHRRIESSLRFAFSSSIEGMNRIRYPMEETPSF